MKLRWFNNLLSIVVIVLGLYIIISPFIPNIIYMFRDTSAETIAPYQGELAKGLNSNTTAPPPEDNRIVIPSIGLNEPIYEGSSIGIINDGGTWHRPQTVTPPEIGNSVIVGHRYYGNSVSTLYHLDKLIENEIFAVYWEGKELLYQITDKKVVPATATEIEGPSEERKLTIYTCHPLWSAKERLVITAIPVAASFNNGENNE